jgi:NADPH:quinone reductase-like Zn-dependent oxidoreductase
MTSNAALRDNACVYESDDKHVARSVASLTKSHQKLQGVPWERSSPPGPDEVLVRVQACDLKHVEHEVSSGAMSQLSAEGGLTAKTILRAAELRPGHTALVIGATSRVGTVLVPLLAEAGAHVIAGATLEDDGYVRALGAAETIEYTTASPIADALASRPDVDLFVDLVSFGEPYFITAGARHGTIVSAVPGADEPGIPRIGISAQPGDLAALAQLADRLPART